MRIKRKFTIDGDSKKFYLLGTSASARADVKRNAGISTRKDNLKFLWVFKEYYLTKRLNVRIKRKFTIDGDSKKFYLLGTSASARADVKRNAGISTRKDNLKFLWVFKEYYLTKRLNVRIKRKFTIDGDSKKFYLLGTSASARADVKRNAGISTRKDNLKFLWVFKEYYLTKRLNVRIKRKFTIGGDSKKFYLLGTSASARADVKRNAGISTRKDNLKFLWVFKELESKR